MSNNFWQQSDKPILALAPMAGVTDPAFRFICSEFGADVVYSEMANVTALKYQPRKTLEMLRSFSGQAPYVIQLFGSDPEEFAWAARLLTQKKEIEKLGVDNYLIPDGIDINFGCPVSKVAKAGAGAELFKDFNNSYQIIRSVIKNTDLPVSIKTRTVAHQRDVLEFLEHIKVLEVSAVMIHGRTLSQGFSGEVDMDKIKQVKERFDGLVLANGGINGQQDAWRMMKKTEADGVGVARGAMGNPWIFEDIKNKKASYKKLEDIYKTVLEQAKLAYQIKGERGVIEMRKHLCWYVTGLPGASRMRERLVNINSIEDIKEVFDQFK
jgi:nifR3 family TIM-barrel protein